MHFILFEQILANFFSQYLYCGANRLQSFECVDSFMYFILYLFFANKFVLVNQTILSEFNDMTLAVQTFKLGSGKLGNSFSIYFISSGIWMLNYKFIAVNFDLDQTEVINFLKFTFTEIPSINFQSFYRHLSKRGNISYISQTVNSFPKTFSFQSRHWLKCHIQGAHHRIKKYSNTS